LIEAQEQERARIGRELHDDINQRLAMMAIELEQLKAKTPDFIPELRSNINELRNQTLEISTSVQTMSHELHSKKLEYLGLAGAIRNFCKECGEAQKVEIEFNSHELPANLPLDCSLCLFRVLQESLHNAVKHSGATRFDVELWESSGKIHLTVSDLGIGFDTKAAMLGTGIGLLSMQERLRLVNGELSIDSQPQRGTRIHASVPLSSQSERLSAAG
jgi:signal transduction histidine kinase